MSNYAALTKHPETGKWVNATWVDDHFGRHRYGVFFPDGKVFREEQIDGVDILGILADDESTTIQPLDEKLQKLQDFLRKPTDMAITKTTTVVDYSIDDFKAIVADKIFEGRDVTIDFVIQEVGGDPMDRFPGHKTVTRVRVSFEGLPQ